VLADGETHELGSYIMSWAAVHATYYYLVLLYNIQLYVYISFVVVLRPT